MFKIVDRTSPKVFTQKPPTTIPMPYEAIEQPVQSQAEIYMALATAIRAKKAAYQPKILKKPEPPKKETIQEVAERIKQSRLKRNDNLPLPIQKEIKPVYLDKNGNECVASVTTHCLNQYANRVKLVEINHKFKDDKDVWASFCHHFNKAKRISDSRYIKRNAKRKDGESPFVIGAEYYAFIIKPDGTVLTFELTGKYRSLNKIHSRKKVIDSGD